MLRASTLGRDGLVALGVAVGVAIIAASLMSALPVPARGAETDRPTDPAEGNLEFVDVASEIGLDFHHGALRWSTADEAVDAAGSGICWIDFDRDGWIDLYAVNNWTEDEWANWQDEGGVPTSRLYRNERGTFVDVTEETGTGLDFHGQGCVAADFDADGFTDLFVSSMQGDAMLWNVNGARFQDGSGAAGVDADVWSTGAAAGDVNGDGLLDLFVAGHEADHRLLLNLGARQFVDAAAELGVSMDDGASGGSLLDVDGDRDLDLVVLDLDGSALLFVNEGTEGALGVRFVAADDSSIEPGPGSDGASWGDFDLDGTLDRFDPSAVSLAEPQAAAVGTAAAAADYDRDGDLDVAVSRTGSPLELFSNRGAGGHWLGVDTTGFPPGTVVEIVDADGETLTRAVMAGSSHLSSEDPRTHFGLGTTRRIERVDIHLPDGRQFAFGATRTNLYLEP